MKQMTTKERMLLYASSQGIISQNALEKQLGLSGSALAHYKDRLPQSIVLRMKATFPKLNTEWLITGNGECEVSESEVIRVEQKEKPTQVPTALIAAKDELIEQLRQTITTKDELIQALREQILLLKGIHL